MDFKKAIKKVKSNHRLAPFTSTPIIGTRAKEIKDSIKSGNTTFFKRLVLSADKKIIITNANKANIRCLEKKK